MSYATGCRPFNTTLRDLFLHSIFIPVRFFKVEIIHFSRHSPVQLTFKSPEVYEPIRKMKYTFENVNLSRPIQNMK